jgi:hypothetical protein
MARDEGDSVAPERAGESGADEVSWGEALEDEAEEDVVHRRRRIFHCRRRV